MHCWLVVADKQSLQLGEVADYGSRSLPTQFVVVNIQYLNAVEMPCDNHCFFVLVTIRTYVAGNSYQY